MIYFVGIGAALGSVLRYLITTTIKKNSRTIWPTATLLINLLGSFLLGILYGLSTIKAAYLIIGVGILGGFTTFSTMNVEILGLIESKKRIYAWWYISISYICGIILSVLGVIMGNMVK
ncbi:fluoride efflux transporter FluC [Liquorilactobacillus mali]|uniref:Fluoride-specific ion channel FluC n=1 Tax=Liquorilactobacillus mali KCTC 3596 = DSM 20444 TaxID=1046596 RepID=J1F3N4_9LACO|nr:CrcB family protein [Liquorilactobacillus mali]EJF00049.1 Protein crcB [Liquorilactobacillus mali KCTC 3596 = DSM 20444]KRN09039.1 camphor resistance protein CrcB [Liquorilactobacillus mali KCTC 3596 = DSM 20444]MDC7953546.1 CrcB family protein [Liquorilactobacillus mali]MDN7145050.1 CrcB family protein [Liquorilactobacillus mali]MDV7758321.1 CrcB family protein [Liquorilactobacillus mali]